MTEQTLNPEHQAYAPATATDVQRTWMRVTNWKPPSQDPAIIKKWDYHKSLAMLSEQAINAGVDK